MAKFEVIGGKKLEGEITVAGNKNSALKLIPATLLADSPTTLTNVPHISDVFVMVDILKNLGAKAELVDHVLTVDPTGLNSFDPDPVLCAKLRASVVLAAPLLVRFGKAVVTPPGGDQIGDRLLDTHFSIKGVGSSILSIQGGKLKGVEHKVMPDHIEGGTFAIAAAITGGTITINDFMPEDHKMDLVYFESVGMKFKQVKDKLHVFPSELIATRRKFQTRPWPGFPTDLMSPFIVLATQTKGTILCHDWMYEWRMFFVDDLIGMGANIFIADPHRVIISGPTKLMADRLFCKDIRAGISVVLAAMVAEGTSMIENVEVIKRGYENLEERLLALGASIKKIDEHEN